MRFIVGDKAGAVKAGSMLSELVDMIEDKLSDDPMIQAIKKKTGKSHLIFIVNGRVVKTDQISRTQLEKGDDVRVHHPFFGG